MEKSRNRIIILLSVFLYSSNIFANNFIHRCNDKLIEVIIGDIFSPPVASRLHSYPNIAAYQVLALNKKNNLTPLEQKLNGLTAFEKPKSEIDYNIAAEKAFCVVAKKLIYSEYKIEQFEDAEYKQWLQNNKNDSTLLNRSIDYGTAYGNHIIQWMLKDNYNYTRTLIRYVLIDHPSAWRPTPPEFMNALEPNWHLMRSFLFDSTTMVKPIKDVKYSEKKGSKYYKNALAVYTADKTLTEEQKHIAYFWDDNPNTSKSGGHLTYFIHKATPGGHWLRIARKACEYNNLDEAQSTRIYTAVALGLYEGFLSCWTEKYISNAVRPETYINRLIDPQFKPLIETPPFPEYTSGHSVISAAAATILTKLIPQPYTFKDSSVLEYGIAPRSFSSFEQAASEASISRFYGGIHYMPALDNGALQGKKIAEEILKKLELF